MTPLPITMAETNTKSQVLSSTKEIGAEQGETQKREQEKQEERNIVGFRWMHWNESAWAALGHSFAVHAARPGLFLFLGEPNFQLLWAAKLPWALGNYPVTRFWPIRPLYFYVSRDFQSKSLVGLPASKLQPGRAGEDHFVLDALISGLTSGLGLFSIVGVYE